MFERNEQEISQLLEKNLEAVLSGKTSVEEALRQHPQSAAGLRRGLEAAVWIHSRREQVQSRPGFTAASRKRIVERVTEESRSRGGKRAILSFHWPRQRLVFQLAAALVIAAMLFSGVGGIVSYAQNALPGQQLYSVKRIGETVSYSLVVNDVRKVELDIQFFERRFEEMEALIESGDMTHVEATLVDYNNEVKQAVAMLQQVDDTLPAEKLILARRLNVGLLKKAERLAGLVASVTDDLRAGFSNAHDLTLNGAAAVLGVQEEMNDLLGTSTPTETATPETVLPATVTVTPTKTPKPTLERPKTGPIDNANPADKEKKATFTPHPTNVHRPTDSGRNPTKEPKPPKEDKPTKTDKKDP